MKKIGNWIIGGVLVFVIVSWFTWWKVAPCHAASYSEAGQKGDMFGSLNVLFTGLAFWGLVFSIILQRRELDQTKKQAAELQEQARLQQIETTFYQLLGCFNRCVDSVNVVITGSLSVTGRYAVNKIHNIIPHKRPIITPVTSNSMKICYIVDYKNVFEGHSYFLSNYYQLALHVLDFIDKAKCNAEIKLQYVKTFRANLSVQELDLLALACVSGEWDGLKQLVEKFAILANQNDKVFDKDGKTLFAPSAFSDAIAFSPEAIKNWDKSAPSVIPDAK